MPQPFNNAIMTNVGARLLTKAQAGEIKIEFIRVEVGNGNYTEDEKTLEALQSQTALKSMKNSYPISDIEVYNDYSVKVTALISNQDSVTGDALITAGYYINEMGLYAKEKDGTDDTEVLYSIAVTAGDNGDFMPPYNGYNPAQIIQDYFATVNNSAEITIQTSGAVALAEDLFEVRKDIELLKRNGAANGYSTETEYHAGEYCIYNNTLYRCLKDTSGEWDPESWEMTNPMEEIGQLKKSIDSLIGLFGRDEEGNMKSLGEAAFAGISHNFLTEEDAGMVAGADLLKLLKEQVDSQNSASIINFTPYCLNQGDSGMNGFALKMGHFVFFIINGMISRATTEEGKIHGLPFKPNWNHVGIYWLSSTSSAVCVIATEGEIILRKSDTTVLTYKDIANKPFFISGCYLTDS